QLGFKTACIDKWLDESGKPVLGGTCLNVGCIPSKALLDSSHHYHNLTHLIPDHGIKVGEISIDIAAMQQRKDSVVKALTGGIQGLFRKNKIAFLPGVARFASSTQIDVVSPAGDTRSSVTATSVIIATGSVPVNIAAAPIDDENVVDSSGALAFTDVPSRLGIIGAGVIGLELGSVWNRLGSKVVILEALDEFLAAVDRQIAARALKALKSQGLDIQLGARVTGTHVRADGQVVVTYEDSNGTQTLDCDKLVVAVGRRPFLEGLNLDAAGVSVNDQGRIEVDGNARTATPNVYAVGDCVRGPMLAHKASEEGIAVAEIIAGQAGHIDFRTVPWVIYTQPEVAWVGQTEADLENADIPFRVGSFPYAALGRAQGAGETQGLVKVIGHAQTDELLGVHIFGAQASEIIAEAVTAMEFRASTEDLARTIHAHPTLSEALHEAALAVDKRAIHS
ncbi:MAG: dihydrolipoamide dehydrogenase, partial [Gammaproteobacteria bacterium]